MGRPQDSSALVHAGIRSKKAIEGGNFACSPVSVMLALFIAMRGARENTYRELVEFIGTPDMPPLPPLPPPPRERGDPSGSLETTEEDSDTESPPPSPKSLWTRLKKLVGRGRRSPPSHSSDSHSGRGSKDSRGAIFEVVARMYVAPETAQSKEFHHFQEDVQQSTAGRAAAEVLDFSEQEKAAETVNELVRTVTQGRIPQVVVPAALSSQTRLLLVAAAFFKSQWMTMFDKEATEKRYFYALKGSKLGEDPAAEEEEECAAPPKHPESEPVLVRERVWMMYAHIQNKPFYAMTTEELDAVGLPYKDARYVMFLIMPRATSKLPLLSIPREKRLEMGFTDTKFPFVEEVVEDMGERHQKTRDAELHVSLPKFHLRAAENTVNLVEVFTGKFGVPGPFTSGVADFENIDGGDGQLFISSFIEGSDIEVHESGTVAARAAATMGETRAFTFAETSLSITLDRPFFFQLRYLGDAGTRDDGEFKGGATAAEHGESAAGATATAPRPDRDAVLFSGEISDPGSAQE